MREIPCCYPALTMMIASEVVESDLWIRLEIGYWRKGSDQGI
jgi:hypothetical protein